MGEARGCQAGNSSFLRGTLLIGDDSLPSLPAGVPVHVSDLRSSQGAQTGDEGLCMSSLHLGMQPESCP